MERKYFFPFMLGLLTILLVFAIQSNLFTQEKIPAVKKEEKKEFLPRQKQSNQINETQTSIEESAITMLIKSLFILAIFIGCAYLLYRWINKKRQFLLTDENAVIKVIKTSSISPNKSLQLVEIGKKIYILGLSDQNISLISTVEDPVEIESVKELCKEEELGSNQSKSFKEILLSNFNYTPKSLNKQSGSAIDNSIHFFNEQKEKLKELKKKF